MKYTLLALLLTACVLEDVDTTPQQKNEVWICHNPESKLHLEECTEECLTAGDQSRYCWLLHVDDCIEPLTYEWQNSCYLLEK